MDKDNQQHEWVCGVVIITKLNRVYRMLQVMFVFVGHLSSFHYRVVFSSCMLASNHIFRLFLKLMLEDYLSSN